MDVVLLTITTLSLAAAAGFGFLSWRVGREERERDRARVAALATAMSPSGPDTPLLAGVAVGSVFERTTDGLRGRLMIKVAAGAMMLLLIGGGVMVSSWMSTSSVEATKSAAPLELISMRYERKGTTLTVSGLVKNPRSGVKVNGLTAGARRSISTRWRPATSRRSSSTCRTSRMWRAIASRSAAATRSCGISIVDRTRCNSPRQ